MKKKINNYLNSIPYRFFSKKNFFYDTLISFEDLFWKKKIEEKKVDTFFYICGYPRSGTTVIANFFNLSQKFCAYTHKDMPLILTPIIWDKFSKIYYKGFKEIQRKHGDAMKIKLNFVDSFEEILWKHYGEDIDFFEKYIYNIKKLVYLRKKTNFLSKSNQNLARISKILKNIPNSKFLIIFRNPLYQLKSLLKVNDIFFKEISRNKFFLNELEFLGHHEFGPNRKFIFENLEKLDEIKENWLKSKYDISYILEWIEVHKMILEKYSNKKEIKLICYDEFKKNFHNQISKISNFCDVDFNQDEVDQCSKIFNFDSSSDNYELNKTNDQFFKEKINEAQSIYNKMLKIS